MARGKSISKAKRLGKAVVLILGVVLGYDWYKHHTSGPITGKRPSAYG